MKKGLSLAVISLLIVASSCASIVSKSRYPVAISSVPQEADITIIDRKGRTVYEGVTPANVMLKSGCGFFSKATYSIQFAKPGYETRSLPLYASLDGWYFGNLVFGGLIGLLIVDPATGAMYRLDTSYINEALMPVTSLNDSGLRIYSLDDVPAPIRGHLVELK
ncbi:MAG: hypothetical protein AAF944_16585 [Bacteroidota bacterium]